MKPSPSLSAMREVDDEISPQSLRWRNALLAARIAADNPGRIAGIRVCSGAGPVRDRWFDHLRAIADPDRPFVRIPASASADSLVGGADIEASLLAGHLVHQRGLLQRAGGGIACLAMAERFPVGHAALLAGAMDRSAASPTTAFLLVALDEAEEGDCCLAPSLADRMTMTIRLDGISIHDAVIDDIEDTSGSRQLHASKDIAVPDAIMTAFAALTAQIPGGGMRQLEAMVTVCRSLARLAGLDAVGPAEAAMAIALCLGVDINPHDKSDAANEDNSASDEQQTASGTDTTQSEPAEPEDDDDGDENGAVPDMGELVLAAAAASEMIRNVLGGGATERSKGGQTGAAGAAHIGSRRGRPAGVSTRPLRPDSRVHIIATLRNAIPFQKLRNPALIGETFQPGRHTIRILPSDFRYLRHKHPTESAAIFAVDASGSTALSRLAEAKGAIEILLNDCYVRRDTVALVSFRGHEAMTLLEPTRSLVRAKRSLAQLPGGGPTPLADGIRLSLEVADTVKRRGQTPLIVLMTDGSGNIALGGKSDRAQARIDARTYAALAVERGYRTIFIDIGARMRDEARDLANAMNAEYWPLPHVSAKAVSGIVERHLRG